MWYSQWWTRHFSSKFHNFGNIERISVIIRLKSSKAYRFNIVRYIFCIQCKKKNERFVISQKFCVAGADDESDPALAVIWSIPISKWRGYRPPRCLVLLLNLASLGSVLTTCDGRRGGSIIDRVTGRMVGYIRTDIRANKVDSGLALDG